MLDISRDGTDVVITVEADTPVSGTKFATRYNSGATWARDLLWWNLHKHMESELMRIRQEAYAEGWKDAKGKKTAKRHWFGGRWK